MPKQQRLRTIDASTSASEPGEIRLSMPRLRRMRPDLFGGGALWHALLVFMSIEPFPHKRMIREQLQFGDSRAAVVMKTNPLLVAAYTDELDCVAMLQFHDSLVAEFGLKPGARLLTVNTYREDGGEYDCDLIPGPNALGRWYAFSPMIADFLTDDIDRLSVRKSQIQEREWNRTAELGAAYLASKPGQYRDGRPVLAGKPARPPAGR
jgi:hypothetical protein